MQLKNNRKGSVQLMYPVTKNGKPDVDFVHIPAGATVELDDAIFEALCKPLTTVSVMEMKEVEIEGEVPVQMDKKNVLIKEFYETGKTKVVNLFKEQIKAGDFTIVSRAAVTKEAMLKVISQAGVDTSKMTDEQIVTLYDKLA
ncbi:gp69 [Erwinia phage vB_EamM-Y2]|uniref:Gp69 n=1 Tax=Erwinia phage vB_EamM-Y2 TaxID=1051676 RepID=G0YQ18_9CAUD|nr:gp69 [Erwinia phage vB_EamM-Y2]AEJ81445.1 gp69 [Erwinia phage vB_EamM-Y2]